MPADTDAATEPASVSQITPLRLRVPRADRTVLAHPPLAEFASLAAHSHRRFADLSGSENITLQGRTLSQLREQSREQILSAAAAQTAQMTGREHATPDTSAPLVVTGHQPDWFHPGVWVKNFGAGALAGALGGVALNLIVDNDTLGERSLNVPTAGAFAGTESIAYDTSCSNCAWEDARIRDELLWESFPDRLSAALRPFGFEPLVSSLWDTVREHQQQTDSLAWLFASSRRMCESEFGLENLELNLSTICESEPFLWFASHLLAHLDRFRDVHNEAIAEYRRVNRIRSAARPVPFLSRRDEWIEAPFWIWQQGGCTRKRVFALATGDEVRLAAEDADKPFAILPLDQTQDACCAVEALRELPAKGLRFRSRALTTTLYSRLCLADAFIHGIGGAKYDEMTDVILRDFYRVTPPPFLTLSATLHLPLSAPFDVVEADATRLHGLLRDLSFNPETVLSASDDPEVRQLVARKAELIELANAAKRRSGLSRSERRSFARENSARDRELRSIRESLTPHAADRRQMLQQELQTVDQQLAANDVLTGREWSFALYPQHEIREFLTGATTVPDAAGQ